MELAFDRKSDSSWLQHVEKADEAQRAGKYEFAETTWMIALEEAQEFGDLDKRLPYTLERLAECMWFQNRFDESLFYGMRALKLYEQILGESHADLGNITGNMARIYHQQKKFQEAEKLYKRSLAIKTSTLGTKHPEVNQLLSGFADLLQSLGRGEEASQLRTSAGMPTRKQWTKTTGSYKEFQNKEKNLEDSVLERPSTAMPPMAEEFLSRDMNFSDFRDEAERAMQRGDLVEAERVWIMSLGVARGDDENNPNYCYALEAIAELSLRAEKYRDAERCFQKSFDIKARVLGRDHVAVGHGAANLAKLYYTMCDYPKAERMAMEAVNIFDRASAGEGTDLACAIHNLATLFHVQRKYDDAEKHYQRAMIMKQKLFGPDHPETVRLLKSYANLLKATHREEQAKHLDDCAEGMITGSWKVVKDENLTGGWRQVLLEES